MSGQAAVVTGAGRGLGEAIAREIAASDVRVVLAGRSLEPLEATRKLINSAGGVAIVKQTDVTDPQSVAELFESAVSEFGGVDVLVNNAGVTAHVNLVDLDEAEWDRVFDTNVRGMFLCSQAVGRRMVARGTGVIVNVASTAAVKTGAGVAHYITSKHAVVGLTRATAVEFGPAGVRVLAVAPSMTQTEGRDAFMASVTAPGMEEFVKEMEERTPLGRIGVADDVARVVLFCASDMSMLMTGSTLMVDSGEGIL